MWHRGSFVYKGRFPAWFRWAAPLIAVLIPVLVILSSMGVFRPDPEVKTVSSAPEGAEVISFAAGLDYAPYSWVDEEGVPCGFDVELATELANRMGRRPEFLFTDWATCKENIASGKANALLGLDLIADNSKLGVANSVPMAVDRLEVYGREKISDSAALLGKRVGISAGSAIRGIYDLNCEYVEYFNYTALLHAIDAGEIDCGICHASVANQILRRDGLKLHECFTLAESFPTIGIPLSDPGLLDAVNENLAAMSEDGTISSLLNKWVNGSRHKDSLTEVLKDEWSFLLIYVMVIVLIWFMIRWTRGRMRAAERESEYAARLEEDVSKRTRELDRKNRVLNRINADIVDFIGDIVEGRDLESGNHIKRVKSFTNILALRVMQDLPEYGLNEETVELITSASALHDVGKIMIPDSILLKPGRLTPEEFTVMKTHSEAGVRILQKAPRDWSGDYLRYSEQICRSHHEKWDGRGYPDGLKGDEIPIAAQIVSVADCFDALTTRRPYKEPFTPEKAFDMIRGGECGVFSEKLMACFEACRSAFIRNTEDLSTETADLGKVLKGLRILLVDDSEITREINREILEEAGATVSEAEDGTEAIRLWQEGIECDIILMDIVMPQMNGIETTRRIREMEKDTGSRIPIIALSGDGTDRQVEECLHAGADDCMTKPLVLSELSRIALTCMRRESADSGRKLEDTVRSVNTDAMTRVKNIMAYSDMVAELSHQIDGGEGTRFAIVVCDLDETKNINSIYGHDAGDRYIRNAGRILCEVYAHSPVFRMGGDEFAAVLQGSDLQNRATLDKELYRRRREAALRDRIEAGRVDFSIGIAEYERGTDLSFGDTLRRAVAGMNTDRIRKKDEA